MKPFLRHVAIYGGWYTISTLVLAGLHLAIYFQAGWGGIGVLYGIAVLCFWCYYGYTKLNP